MRKKFGLGGGVLTLGGVVKKEIAKTAVKRKDQLLQRMLGDILTDIFCVRRR